MNSNKKTRMTSHVQTVLVFLISVYSLSSACPPQCNGCSGGTANCLRTGLRDIPQTFPMDTIVIDLTYNQITELREDSFQSLPNVESLRMSGNGISYVEDRAFGHTPMLMSLDLSMNPITLIHDRAFEGLMKVRTITLTHNNLRMIGNGFQNMTSLSSLYLSFNRLTQLQENDFEGLKNLRMLELSNNQISSIHTNTFKDLEMLRYLIINNNPLVTVRDLVFTSSVLQSVDFSECQLTSVPTQMPASVADFRLGNNEIMTLNDGDFEGMDNLRLLTLNDNNLKNVSYRALKGRNNLKELWISRNQLYYVPQGLPSSLQNLFMENNEVYEIHSMAFSEVPNIKVVDLEMNQIQSIDKDALKGLAHLENFDVQGNQIASINRGTFSDLESLIKLQLSNNPINNIESGAFNNLPNMSSLALSHIKTPDTSVPADMITGLESVNHIRLLDSPALAENFLMHIQHNQDIRLPGVHVLGLEYNNLRTLPSNLRAALPNIQTISLVGNSLHCDKRLLQLKRWIGESREVFQGEPVTCMSPENVRDREVANLADDEFADVDPQVAASNAAVVSTGNVSPPERSGGSSVVSIGSNTQITGVLMPSTVSPSTSKPTRKPRRRKNKKGKKNRKGKGRKGKKGRKGRKKRNKNKRRGKRNHKKPRRLRRKIPGGKRKCKTLPDGTLRCRRGRKRKAKTTSQPSILDTNTA